MRKFPQDDPACMDALLDDISLGFPFMIKNCFYTKHQL
jgi:hypothetical protein